MPLLPVEGRASDGLRAAVTLRLTAVFAATGTPGQVVPIIAAATGSGDQSVRPRLSRSPIWLVDSRVIRLTIINR